MTSSPVSKKYHPDLIVEEANNGWRIVRLNRPKSLHALDESIVSALLEVFQDFHSDDSSKSHLAWIQPHQKHSVQVVMCVNLRQLVINDEVATAK